jgi:isoleucyl-tRNA synthetase
MEIVDQYGADALRFALMNSAVTRAEDLKFSEEGVKDVLKTLIIPLWNAYSFFVTYANIDGYEPDETPFDQLDNPMDRWIVSLSESLVQEVTEAWDHYETQRGCSALVTFLDSLNNWYIRRSRRRFWRSENDTDKKKAYDTLYRVLMTFVRSAAPVIPFTTEEIYRNLKTTSMIESVHLSDFPTYNAIQRDTALERKMAITRQAVTMGRSLRSTHNLKIRQPLKQVFLVTRDPEERSILHAMQDIIEEELNIKSISIQADESNMVTYQAKANFKVLGKQLGKYMKDVAAKIQDLESDQIAKLLEGNNIHIAYEEGTISIGLDDVVIQRTEREHMRVLNEGQLTVGFDTEITHDLLLEGLARDIVRAVQNLRKEQGFDVSDRIALSIYGNELVRETTEQFGSYIANETLADTMTFTQDAQAQEVPCGDTTASIWVEKR